MAFLSDSKLLFQTHAEQIAGSVPSGSINCNSHKMHNECQKGVNFNMRLQALFPHPTYGVIIFPPLPRPSSELIMHYAACVVV